MTHKQTKGPGIYIHIYIYIYVYPKRIKPLMLGPLSFFGPLEQGMELVKKCDKGVLEVASIFFFSSMCCFFVFFGSFPLAALKQDCFFVYHGSLVLREAGTIL